MSHLKRFMPAEWHQQDGILIAWPHLGTDWADMIDEVTGCYIGLARAIARHERLLIVAPDPEEVRSALGEDCCDNITFYALPTNDTWTRDYGPITVIDDGQPVLLDFTFNAWGMKFAADCDNMVTRRMGQAGAFKAVVDSHLDMVLEGGSIESDGRGTIMTTRQCLLSSNRNDAWSENRIAQELCDRLGAAQVLWLDHEPLAGDDTDAHIDTMARFAPGNVVLVVDEALSRQVARFTDASGVPYRPVVMPAPPLIDDELGMPLPATYLNFLITNRQVLVPTYGCETTDRQAIQMLADYFPGREVHGIDCRALIKQHGSLHCATMQFPANTLNK